MQLAYFAGDGNYGMENGNFVLCDVSNWTDEDWGRVADAPSHQRPRIANEIAWNYQTRPIVQDLEN
jgi:hypothetical protein